MRIALFAEQFLPEKNGDGNALCYLLEYFEANGHESILVAPEGGPSNYAGSKIIGLQGFPVPWYPELRLCPPLISAREELFDFFPEVIHLVNPASLGIFGLWHGKEMRIPVVASYQADIQGCTIRWGMPYLKEALWGYYRWLYNQADLNLAPSNYTQAELLNQGFERVRVWSSGVATQRFSPVHHSDEIRRYLSGGESDKTLLLSIGDLTIENRMEKLLPVLKALPDVRLAIVGSGPEENNLKRLFRETPTVFAGDLRGNQLSQALASSDIFVYISEGQASGNLVLEAMASGLAVVAPSSGGILDFVQNGENGLLYDPQNEKSLMDTVQFLIYRHEIARALGNSARKYAEQRDWKSVFDGLMDEYQLAIETKQKASQLEARMTSQFFPNHRRK